MLSAEKLLREELRLCMLKILYEAAHAIRGKTVRGIADAMGYPTTWEGFTRAIEYLRAEHLIYCFPANLEEPQSEVEAAKFVAMLMCASFDSPESSSFLLKITPRGKRFIEGNERDIAGVAKP